MQAFTFRSADFAGLIEEILSLRGAICCNLPEVAIEGPPIKIRLPERFKPSSKTQHFCGKPCLTLSNLNTQETYEGWCNYRNFNRNPVVPMYIKWLEHNNKRELSVHYVP